MAGTKRPADRELGGRARKLLREVRPCRPTHFVWEQLVSSKERTMVS
jgi:hypothetical protein